MENCVSHGVAIRMGYICVSANRSSYRLVVFTHRRRALCNRHQHDENPFDSMDQKSAKSAAATDTATWRQTTGFQK